jgi:hypothetical protein
MRKNISRVVPGMKFNMLTVLEHVGYQAGMKVWKCKCECGNESIVRTSNLTAGHVKSCGCLMTARIKTQMTKHNHAKRGQVSPTYKTWQAMKQRCFNKNSKSYKNYGGRRITICKRWLVFANFLMDMSERPEGMTIHRIDNDGHYEPGNCLWATRLQQSQDQRTRWCQKQLIAA